MKFVLNGINYQDCPVAEREKTSFTSGERHSLLKEIHAQAGINEVAILQTCNRIEFYFYVSKNFDVTEYLKRKICALNPQADAVWRKYSKSLEGKLVIKHLFEVAAGLDSQMLGENQILSQVKGAYRESVDYRTSRFVFHRLFHFAFRTGKAVRTETDINREAVSISLAAVEAAKERVDFSSAKGLVVGAGENAELACRYLVKNGLKELLIANRNKSNAESLSRRLGKGEVIGLGEIAEKLICLDFVICSTAAEEPILKYDDVEGLLSKRDKPILIIDIAVPRDVEESIKQFSCVDMFNIDDLNGKIKGNIQKRNEEIPKAKRIVKKFTDEFVRWYDSLAVVPAIKRLSRMGSELARSEAERYAKDFHKADREKLKVFAESLVKKMLHEPISFLKGNDEDELGEEQLEVMDLINKMFFSEDTGD